MKKFGTYLTKPMIVGCVGGILAILIIVLFIGYLLNAKEPKKNDDIAIAYETVEEQELAKSVEAYLAQYLELSQDASDSLIETTVSNYKIVMRSETDVIDDAITEAVKRRIASAILAFAGDKKLTDDEVDALSAGITELIWNKVLEQIETSAVSDEAAYKKEYMQLTQSLQEQIDLLREQKTKVSINARIIDNSEVTQEKLLEAIEEMDEEELELLAAKLGMSKKEIQELKSSIIKNGEDLSDNVSKELEKEIYDLRRDLEKEISMSTGKTGDTGKAGEKGQKGDRGERGNAGKDGKNGADGKTTYIAYADDKNGTNFSLVPTETSKYVGTCISDEAVQPSDFVLYSNWQEYRTYIITSTTDEQGVTTVHIR